MHLVRAYLRAFGPAPWRDIGLWAGITATAAKRGGEGLELVTYRDEAGRPLVDLPDQPLPDPGTRAPVRFLPHWDALLLVHARRTGVLPEAYRPRIFASKNPFSVGTVLVDGRVVAAWSLKEGRVVIDPYEPIGATGCGGRRGRTRRPRGLPALTGAVDQAGRWISWTAQRLPSGSAKKMNRPHGKSWISPVSTPRPASSSRAATMSATTSCIPTTEPGAASVIPVPIVIEQAEPGGVSWMNRSWSDTT